MNREEYDEALYLAHHGVKGQRWGHRRYQNEDGSYKSGAEGRYDSDSKSEYKSAKKAVREARSKMYENSSRVLGVFKETKKEDRAAYDKAKTEANLARLKMERERSEKKGKATRGLIKSEGIKKYDELYDKYLAKGNDPDKAHEKAKAGRKEHEQDVKTSFYRGAKEVHRKNIRKGILNGALSASATAVAITNGVFAVKSLAKQNLLTAAISGAAAVGAAAIGKNRMNKAVERFADAKKYGDKKVALSKNG